MEGGWVSNKWGWMVFIVGWICVFGRLKCVVFGGQNVFVNLGKWGIKIGWNWLKSKKQTATLELQMVGHHNSGPVTLILRWPPLWIKGAAHLVDSRLPETGFLVKFIQKEVCFVIWFWARPSFEATKHAYSWNNFIEKYSCMQLVTKQ